MTSVLAFLADHPMVPPILLITLFSAGVFYFAPWEWPLRVFVVIAFGGGVFHRRAMQKRRMG